MIELFISIVITFLVFINIFLFAVYKEFKIVHRKLSLLKRSVNKVDIKLRDSLRQK